MDRCATGEENRFSRDGRGDTRADERRFAGVVVHSPRVMLSFQTNEFRYFSASSDSAYLLL